MGNCLLCNKEFESYLGYKKKFCSDSCRAKFNSKERYKRLRSDTKFVENNRSKFKAWYENNKERHKIRMKEYMREYYRKKHPKKEKEEENASV
jgi:hypothetical protein